MFKGTDLGFAKINCITNTERLKAYPLAANNKM